MSEEIAIRRATVHDVQAVAGMVGELLREIMDSISEQAFSFNHPETADWRRDFLERERYFVFMARSGSKKPAGFIALCESCAL
jgi:hypothetical protein